MNRVALVLLLGLVVVAVAGPWLTPLDPNEQELADALLPPAAVGRDGDRHWLGTDYLGRDVASRLIAGARISVSIALGVVLVASSIGTLIGLIAAFWGGLADKATMAIVDVQLSLPFMLLAIAVMGALGPGISKMMIVLILVTWAVYARFVRGMALSVREQEFVIASHAMGASPKRIVLRHMLPNIADGLIVLATLETAQMVIAEAALSYLGLGVSSPSASWGSMLADGRSYVQTSWWLSTVPGLAIFVTVLCINLVGTSLREVGGSPARKRRSKAKAAASPQES